MDEQGLTVQQRITKMRQELDALQQIQTQEDHDEGARLHNLHNAPWVKGPYSHLVGTFPMYKFQPFPMMLYSLDYLEAVKARDEAELIPAYGMDDKDRKKALTFAERRIKAATRVVPSEPALRAVGAGWFESPAAVAEHFINLQREIEVQAAHRAHDDRKMSPKAKREIDQYDEQADHFVTEIPQARKAGPRKRVKV